MTGIYISWPFCAQKCTYCNFASGVLPKELESQYLEAVRREIRTASPTNVDTLYLGGGTPSAMDPAAISQLLADLEKPWLEATIETAPAR